MFCKSSLCNILSVLCLLLSALPLFAQYGASIEGTVADATGAVVPGATVTATNEATGVSRNTVTGDAGFYHIAGLTPGNYTIDVEAKSFPKKSVPNVQVAAEVPRGLDVALTSGSEKESVTVTADTGGLETENANVTNTFSSRQIIDLPEYGRDPYELLRLTPGLFGDSARQGNGNSSP